MFIKTWRNPYDTGVNLTKPKEIEIKEGLTVLVGCNGAGKTTLLNNIKDFAHQNKIPCHLFDNLQSGGNNSFASLLGGYEEYDGDSIALGICLWNASEGESIKINLNRESTLYNEFLKTGYFKNKKYKFSKLFSDEEEKFIKDNKRILLFDATDSGLSIDAICELKFLFECLINRAKEIGIELYIIISANEYELCRNENCFDVNDGKYITFEDYEDYRTFILKNRIKKNKRIDKEIAYKDKKTQKNLEKLAKLKEKNLIKIKTIEDKAKNENRELSYYEKYQIDDLKREIRSFIRDFGLSNEENID